MARERTESWVTMGWVSLVVAILVVGCETKTSENQGTVSLAELQGVTAPAATETTNGTGTVTDTGTTVGTATNTGSNTDVEINGTESSTNSSGGMWPSEIKGSIQWLHTNVSSWPVTASLTASIGGDSVRFPYSKTSVWPRGRGSVANAVVWVFVNQGGQWYAGTWEYLAPGQTSKPRGVFNGSSIKKAPLSGWRPHSGERVGIMVSGLARTAGITSVRERSNVYMCTVP